MYIYPSQKANDNINTSLIFTAPSHFPVLMQSHYTNCTKGRGITSAVNHQALTLWPKFDTGAGHWANRHWGCFFPGTCANSQSIDCSIFIIITSPDAI
jgi:hypothetical protein